MELKKEGTTKRESHREEELKRKVADKNCSLYAVGPSIMENNMKISADGHRTTLFLKDTPSKAVGPPQQLSADFLRIFFQRIDAIKMFARRVVPKNIGQNTSIKTR